MHDTALHTRWSDPLAGPAPSRFRPGPRSRGGRDGGPVHPTQGAGPRRTVDPRPPTPAPLSNSREPSLPTRWTRRSSTAELQVKRRHPVRTSTVVPQTSQVPTVNDSLLSNTVERRTLRPKLLGRSSPNKHHLLVRNAATLHFYYNHMYVIDRGPDRHCNRPTTSGLFVGTLSPFPGLALATPVTFTPGRQTHCLRHPEIYDRYTE
jgi:hypothetical protein